MLGARKAIFMTLFFMWHTKEELAQKIFQKNIQEKIYIFSSFSSIFFLIF